MIIFQAIRQLVKLNYEFIANKFKEKLTEQPNKVKFESIFYDKTVLNGVFKGLKYPNLNSVCSTIYPKLLGSYEQEVQTDLIELINEKPSLILDIGCAEGYYAVGLAKVLPDCQVVAADTSEEARQLCKELAKFNGTTNITITGTIDADSLIKFDLKNALVICDCEGFEKFLFTEKNISYLHQSSLIIETHDFHDPSISIYLEDLFSKTHNIKVIASIDDLQKPKYYHYNELKGLTYEEKKEILAELRPKIMEWLILTPLQKT